MIHSRKQPVESEWMKPSGKVKLLWMRFLWGFHEVSQRNLMRWNPCVQRGFGGLYEVMRYVLNSSEQPVQPGGFWFFSREKRKKRGFLVLIRGKCVSLHKICARMGCTSAKSKLSALGLHRPCHPCFERGTNLIIAQFSSRTATSNEI